MGALFGMVVSLAVFQAFQPPATPWFRPDGSVNWDAEKRPIDTIVIHHTAEPSGMTWQRLSEIQHGTLYVPRYQSKSDDPYVFGQTPHSGHFRRFGDGKVEVFYAYHWLIRPDGSAERLLQDDEVGWHAGNWDMNCRSIAICFDGDFSVGPPTDAAMQKATSLIRDYKQKFNIKEVLGHNDVRASTTCPGPWFRSGGKELLLR
jgi:hypothetical protein